MTCPTHESGSEERSGVFVLLLDLLELAARIIFACLGSAFRCVVPPPKKSLRGEVVLVTGAARGLGRELALKLADEKAVLVLWDVDEEGIQHVKTEIEIGGGIAHAYRCDVTDIEEVNRTGGRVEKEVGDVTIVVNNAGVAQNVCFNSLRISGIRKTIEVNLLAHFWINKFFLPKMMEKKKGHIVAIASVGGKEGWPYLADYSASKFGVMGMMEVLEEEIRIFGLAEKVHFTSVCPITIDTGMCQHPTTRFPSIFPILKVRQTAHTIVDAVQRNDCIVVIPRTMRFMLFLRSLFPKKVSQLVADFVQYNTKQNTLESLKE